jgi:hypothetical protein
MAGLSKARVTLVRRGTIKKASFPLALLVQAWSGGIACIDTANPGYVAVAAAGSTTLKPLGWFIDDVLAAASGLTYVGVEFFFEREVAYWDALATGTPTIANLFQTLYIGSDHEVTTTSTSNSPAGTMFGIGPQGYPGGIMVAPVIF